MRQLTALEVVQNKELYDVNDEEYVDLVLCDYLVCDSRVFHDCYESIVESTIEPGQEMLLIYAASAALSVCINNVKARAKPANGNSLHSLLHEMRQEEGAVTELVLGQSNELVAIAYQDVKMSRLQSRFPELLLLDATYKLNDIRMPLYVLMVLDGNGESVVVGL